jgi:hypothetical protein
MKSVPMKATFSKPFTGKLQSPSLNNKENNFFASVALICLLFFVGFFSTGLAGYQNIIDRFLMAHSKAISNIYVIFVNSAICMSHMTLK